MRSTTGNAMSEALEGRRLLSAAAMGDALPAAAPAVAAPSRPAIEMSAASRPRPGAPIVPEGDQCLVFFLGG